MTIIGVILVLIVIGVALWLLNTYVPMAAPIKAIINALAVILIIVWLLQIFGLFSAHVPPLK